MFCHCWIFFFFFLSFLLEITFIQEGAPRKSYKHENLCITVPLTARVGNSMTQVFHRGRVQDGGCLKPVHVDLKPKRSPGCVPDTEKRDKSTALWSKKVRFLAKKRLVAATQVWHGFPKVWASARRRTERCWNRILSVIPKHFRGSLCLCDNINGESESAKSTSTDDGRKSPPRTAGRGSEPVSWGAGRCFRSSLAAPGSSLW